MRQLPPISDADLHAYADGQLDPQRRSAVEAHLDADPQAEAQVQHYLDINRLLRDRYAAVADEPIPPRLLRQPRQRRWPLAAAALAWLCVGVGGGTLLGYHLGAARTASIETELVAPAAFAHAVYAPERRHPVEVSGDQEAQLVTWLSNRLHREVRPPDLGGIGYRLVGGRLLPSTDRMAAQFMFEDPQGRRITLYTRAGAWAPEKTAFHYATRNGVGVLYWTDGVQGYALSGAVDESELLRIAAASVRTLEPRREADPA